jgi:serine protein kinase
MTENQSAFSEIIEKDRSRRQAQDWSGPFIEYLELVRADPTIPQLAHARLHDLIVDQGVSNILDAGETSVRRLFVDDPVKIYDFFKEELFGIERSIAQIVRYFHSAALQGEECRQVLYLMGPVGAGKSSIVEMLKRGLEIAEPVYAIKGCPMAEEPLHLVPRHLREEFEKMLEVRIEGQLCPVCRFRLDAEFKGRYEEVPVHTVRFSKHRRRGVGVVPPVDPNNQDTSVLIGSEDISKLDMAWWNSSRYSRTRSSISTP